MRLSFHVSGGEILGALESGALSFRRGVPYGADRIRELTNEVMVILGGGGREHTLSAAHLRRLREVGAMLSQELVHPELAARLPVNDEAVFLQVDESLVAVPWELLYDGESFWCRRFDLGRAVQTPQAMVAKASALPAGPLRMLVICSDPRGDLPHVNSEGEALIERFDADNNVDATLMVLPTVEQVRRQLPSYDVVHFAGHADHDALSPQQSGWHLADGKLTAEQVASMGTARRMPFLVFANACNSTRTGEWGGDAGARALPVYGLANAFLLAGVSLYVGTQQEIVDGQSEQLSIAYYEALARGAAAGQAMRVARREIVREQGEEAMAWASYVLYGDPALTPIRPSEFRSKEALSSTLREARVALPAKRVVEAKGARTRERGAKGRRLLFWGVGLSAAATLTALGLSLFLLMRGERVPGSPGEGTEVPQFVQGEERVADAPKVALVAPPGTLRGQMERALAGDARFTLAGVAEGEAQTMTMARAFARSVNAELVILVHGDTVEVADVLTGDAPIKRRLGAAEPACRALLRAMARTFLAEGEVVAVEGDSVTVNLGWKSRIAPGTTLSVLRGGRVIGHLEVQKVEIDRCIARGSARKGDLVRAPR